MRLYRRLLKLGAPSLEREYGAAMKETVERKLADPRLRGAWPRARLWTRELAGLAALAASERWGSGARDRRRRERLDSRYGTGIMDTLGQDLRQAARRLRRAPAFTTAAVLTLSLAIGANAAIFAIVQRVVLNPLPYPESDRLIELDHGAQALKVTAGMGLTQGLYFHYLNRSRTLESAAVYCVSDVTVTGPEGPERVPAARVSPSLTAVLRAPAALGRWFSEAEGRPGAASVAVLSDGLWTRRFGRNPAVIGQSVTLSGVPTTIVGVMPPEFAFPNPRVEAWIAEPLNAATGFGLWLYSGVARLRDGVSVEEARAELNGLVGDVVQAYPGDPFAVGNVQSHLSFSGRPLKDATIGNAARALWILLASVGLVLLVACANVANLFLVRSDARQREVAVRQALGAGRGGLARFFFMESAMLSAAGGLVGLALAWAAVRIVVTLGPANLPRLHEVRLDTMSVMFAALLALAAALAFAAIPFWRPAPVAMTLHETGRGNTAGRRRHHVRHVLMGVQVAMALVLLVASGLMIRSVQNIRGTDPGFDASSALTFSLALSPRDYPTREVAVRTHLDLLDRLAAVPGVVSASAASCLPFAGGCHGNTILIEGRVLPPGTIPPLALFRAVAGDYFQTMGMRILRGRGIERGDVERRLPIVVISDTIAKRYFAGEDPIGQRVASNRPPPRPGVPGSLDWLEVVGVVSDTPMRAIGDPTPVPQLFMPMSIAGGPDIPRLALVGPDISLMSYVLRTATTPASVLTSARGAVEAVDRNLAVAQVRTLQEILDRASAQMAFTMTLLAIAAAVALVLGIIGIYGVMSYIVSQRTGEIGVRLALGAEPGRVAAAILRQGTLVSMAGVAVGLAAALAGGRVMASLLFGISPRDPYVLAGTTTLLLVVALVACWLPARRAARLSPLEALRTE